MPLPKRIIGRKVTIYWFDPRSLKLTSYFPHDHRDLPHGRAGLARWEEDGTVEKIEEGVIYLRQGIAKDPPGEERQQHELQVSVVPEGLVERVILWPTEGGETLPGEMAESPK